MAHNDGGDRDTPHTGTVGRDERSAGERRAGVTLDDLAGMIVDARKDTNAGFANVLGQVAEVNRRVGDVEERLFELEEDVYSLPPPPMAGGEPSGARAARVAAARVVRRRPASGRRPHSLTGRADTAEAKLDELAGAVVAARAEAQTAREAAERAEQTAHTVESINKQQSRAMGLSKPEESMWRKFVNLALSREGVKLAGGFLGTVAAVAGMIAALSAKGSAEKASQDAERAADRPAAVVLPVPPPPSSRVVPPPSPRPSSSP